MLEITVRSLWFLYVLVCTRSMWIPIFILSDSVVEPHGTAHCCRATRGGHWSADTQCEDACCGTKPRRDRTWLSWRVSLISIIFSSFSYFSCRNHGETTSVETPDISGMAKRRCWFVALVGPSAMLDARPLGKNRVNILPSTLAIGCCGRQPFEFLISGSGPYKSWFAAGSSEIW